MQAALKWDLAVARYYSVEVVKRGAQLAVWGGAQVVRSLAESSRPELGPVEAGEAELSPAQVSGSLAVRAQIPRQGYHQIEAPKEDRELVPV